MSFYSPQETQAVHMNMKAGSYLEFTIPWVMESEGYVSKINGQLMHLDATTSLQFRQLVECETLEVRDFGDIQCGDVITWLIFSKIITKDTQ